MKFYIHDTFKDMHEHSGDSMNEVADAVKAAMGRCKLYVTNPLPGEELFVNPNSIVGHVISFDTESHIYTCVFDSTAAGRALVEWGELEEGVHFTGFPRIIYDRSKLIVTQIVMMHEWKGADHAQDICKA